MPEGKKVQSMFAGISSRYDFANHLLSGGVDFYWRRKLVRMVAAEKPQRIADLATGSGDVAFALARVLPQDVRIHGLDFCEPMLEEARRKRDEQPRYKNRDMPFDFGDCLSLPLEDESTDAITISFGLRNLEDRQAGLVEMRRILKKGSGYLYVLEFSQPKKWFRPIYYAYLKAILPWLAKLATRNRSAYDYLAGSIESFPTKEAITAELKQAGFSEIEATHLTFGIVAIHRAKA